jgi:hypothetical protein
MYRSDVTVFYDRDFKWYWRFRCGDETAVDKSREGYPTRAEAWRGVTRYLISLLSKKR